MSVLKLNCLYNYLFYVYLLCTSILFFGFETMFWLEHLSFLGFWPMWLVLWMPNISVCETFSPIHKFEVEKTKCVAFFVLEAFDFDRGDQFDGQWRPLRAQMDLEKNQRVSAFKKKLIFFSVKSKYLGIEFRIFKKLY